MYRIVEKCIVAALTDYKLETLGHLFQVPRMYLANIVQNLLCLVLVVKINLTSSSSCCRSILYGGLDRFVDAVTNFSLIRVKKSLVYKVGCSIFGAENSDV